MRFLEFITALLVTAAPLSLCARLGHENSNILQPIKNMLNLDSGKANSRKASAENEIKPAEKFLISFQDIDRGRNPATLHFPATHKPDLENMEKAKS